MPLRTTESARPRGGPTRARRRRGRLPGPGVPRHVRAARRSWSTATGVTYDTGLDPGAAAFTAFEGSVFPVAAFIDEAGTIRNLYGADPAPRGWRRSWRRRPLIDALALAFSAGMVATVDPCGSRCSRPTCRLPRPRGRRRRRGPAGGAGPGARRRRRRDRGLRGRAHVVGRASPTCRWPSTTRSLDDDRRRHRRLRPGVAMLAALRAPPRPPPPRAGRSPSARCR